jgi:hypothetical protein
MMVENVVIRNYTSRCPKTDPGVDNFNNLVYIFISRRLSLHLLLYFESCLFRYTSIFLGYWLAYKDGVYDVSPFVENHPGGKQILITAGKALEACWKIFTIHQIEHVYEILEEYRIGNLPPGITKILFRLKI